MIRFLIVFLIGAAFPAFAEDTTVSVTEDAAATEKETVAATPEPAGAEVPDIMPKPYAATYAVKYRGFKVGSLKFNLRPKQDGTYVYETRAQPGLIARLLVSPDAVERSVVEINGEGVRPLRWFSEDGTSDTEDDGELAFDWAAQQVSGTVEDKAVTMATEPGLQDRLSMQVAVLLALQRGLPPGPIVMIDEDRIKHYSYDEKGPRQIEAAAGRYDTVLYESTRQGSSRLKRIYHAPTLGYIPVRFENLKNGKLETVLELVSVSPANGAHLEPAE